MRAVFAVLSLTLLVLALPGPASADCVHVVTQGETLTSIAAADGLSVGALAAANGLASTAEVIIGTCLQIPPQSAAAGAGAPPPAGGGDGDGDGDDPANSSAASAPATPAAAAAPAAPSAGSYTVQPGDTLSAIAARAGLSLSALAAANGIDPQAPLLSGTVLRLSGDGSPASAALPQSAGVASGQPIGAAAEGSPVSPPYPTPQSVSPSEVGSIAAANGVPPALAEAVAYQESGFNNGAVSSADARGVMQILPGTWDWIQNTLTAGGDPLAAASATDNIRGGVLLLHSLLNATAGNSAMAAAAYYQGLRSVEANGMYPSTQQYVNDVLALEHRFGGG